MGRTHVVQIIHAAQLERSDMLGNPALADAIDLLEAHHTLAVCPLPHFQPSVRGQPTSGCRPHILKFDENHGIVLQELVRDRERGWSRNPHPSLSRRSMICWNSRS